MKPRLFAVATATVLLLSACGGSISESQTATAESSASSATASASASSAAPETSNATTAAETASSNPTSAEATSAEPASEETSTPAATTDAVSETPVAETTNETAQQNEQIAAVGTNCGKIDRPGAVVSTVILGGQTSCATATSVMNQFYDSMENTPSQTINGFACQKTVLYRETGTYAICTEPVSAAYVEMRSAEPLLSGPVADAEAYYSTEGNFISFHPAGAKHAVSCAVENGAAIECDGFSYDSNPATGAAAWNVKMTVGQQPVIREGRTQGGVYKSFMYARPLDIGTVINFQGGSCKALSSDSIECAVYGGGHFVLSDQGVQQ